MVVFIFFFNTGQTPNVGFVFTNFLAHEGYYLNVTTVGTELIQDSSDCAFKCLEKDPCLSFNLADLDDNIDNLLCELLPSDHYTHSDKFITNHLWYHYSIAVKLFFFFYFIFIIIFFLLFHSDNSQNQLKSFEQILFNCSTLIHLSSEAIFKSFYLSVIEVCLTGFYEGSK